MSTERDAAIVKSARQLSQACSELFAHLGEDLDRRMRAALRSSATSSLTERRVSATAINQPCWRSR
jgi:hypothetical protein